MVYGSRQEMEKVVLENRQMPLHYQIANYLLNMLKTSEMSPEVKLLDGCKQYM